MRPTPPIAWPARQKLPVLLCGFDYGRKDADELISDFPVRGEIILTAPRR
jgi:hypothetical protein